MGYKEKVKKDEVEMELMKKMAELGLSVYIPEEPQNEEKQENDKKEENS